MIGGSLFAPANQIFLLKELESGTGKKIISIEIKEKQWGLENIFSLNSYTYKYVST